MALEISRQVEAPVRMVEVKHLRLDTQNPRRTEQEVKKTQTDLLVEIQRRFDLDDLLASLAAYGYFSEEP